MSQSSDQPASSASSSQVNPLLEAIVNLRNISKTQPHSISLNDALHRSFGAPLEAVYGAEITLAPLSRKRKLEEEEDDEDDGRVPRVIQGEIARLRRPFKVALDSTTPQNSK